MLKPKDVKFKRINKTKARSLEELRDKLKGDQPEEEGVTEESGKEQDSTDELGFLQTISGRLAMERRTCYEFDSLTEPFVPPLNLLSSGITPTPPSSP